MARRNDVTREVLSIPDRRAVPERDCNVQVHRNRELTGRLNRPPVQS
jgi:hypothetical protein